MDTQEVLLFEVSINLTCRVPFYSNFKQTQNYLKLFEMLPNQNNPIMDQKSYKIKSVVHHISTHSFFFLPTIFHLEEMETVSITSRTIDSFLLLIGKLYP